MELSVIIPLKNRTNIVVNYEPPGFSVFANHTIELSHLKHHIIRKGNDIVLPLLLKNLDSFNKWRNKYDLEIILVDFGSTDYAMKKLKGLYHKLDLIIIKAEGDFSRGRGLNIGLKKATKKNVMFCDADIMFTTDQILKFGLEEIGKGKAFFPVVFDLLEPSHQIGHWRETGYGIMFGGKNQMKELNFKWSEYDKLGKEDEDAYEFFQSRGLTERYRVPDYYHQWHPSSKFFKNSNYKTGKSLKKILVNFDIQKVDNETELYYVDCLRNEGKYLLVSEIETDIDYVLVSEYPELVDLRIIAEYEKKYMRRIPIHQLNRFDIKLSNFYYYGRKFPGNAEWLNKVLEWMRKIDSLDHIWSLEGTSLLPLSSASLFCKLVKIFGNYGEFDAKRLRNKMLKFLDHTDFMFKQDKSNEKILSESRQAYSGLMNLGYHIWGNNKYDVKLDDYYSKPLYFMNTSYWKNPWKAGAHLSHYVFFCQMRGQKEELELIFKDLDLYWRGDGWYSGNPTEEQWINGIMKIYTAYDVIGEKVKVSQLMVDRALRVKVVEGGCGIYDMIYILVRFLDFDYRIQDIKDQLYLLYDRVLEHQMEDGGFKYSLDKKKDTYAGVEIVPEGKIGSIHATTVFCMGLAMLDNALNLGMGLNLATS